MDRRGFIEAAFGSSLLLASPAAKALAGRPLSAVSAEGNSGKSAAASMPLGLLIKPAHGPEATIARVQQLGMSTCFFFT